MSNMNLVLPTVSQTPGPQWASIINSDLTLIDQHDHTSNKGLPIPTAGLNINDELKFNNTTPNGLPATGLSYLGLISPQSPPAPARVFSDAAGDFYYRNTAGVDVQLTVGNNPAGTPGSITGLTGTSGSASYDSGAGAFYWRKGANEGATMDSGPLRLRDGSAGSNAVTITPASGTSNYTLTLPSAAPGAQSILTVASSGISTFATVNSTLTLTSSLLKVADLGIDTAQINNLAVSSGKLALNAVTTAKIADGNVTQSKWGAKTVSSSVNVGAAGTNSTSPTAVSGLTVSQSLRSGHSVVVQLAPTLSGFSSLQVFPSASVSGFLYLECNVTSPSGTSSIPVSQFWVSQNGSVVALPVSAYSFVYLPLQNGSHSFEFYWSVNNSTVSALCENVKLIAYEA
jgi:hypothetical protein